MSELKLDIYYDITCKHCGRTRSRDFSCGIAITNQAELLEKAAEDGWKIIDGKNACPICARIHYVDTPWKSVKDVEPPVDKRLTGVDSSTSTKYMVLTKEGHIVEGYIYLNKYSCSGYAVWLGGDDYFNNVTHWIPGDYTRTDKN
jgi:hypothetical protein